MIYIALAGLALFCWWLNFNANLIDNDQKNDQKGENIYFTQFDSLGHFGD